jgi:hypothetical protein
MIPNHDEQIAVFIYRLSKFLVEGQAMKSMKLQARNDLAIEWAALRNTIPQLFWWITVEEAQRAIKSFLYPSESQEPPRAIDHVSVELKRQGIVARRHTVEYIIGLVDKMIANVVLNRKTYEAARVQMVKELDSLAGV